MKRMMLIISLVIGFVFTGYGTSMASDTCDKLADQAQLVMEARQQGEPRSRVMDSYRSAFAGEPHNIKVGEFLTQDAYNYPIKPRDQDAYITIIEFRNKWYDKCREEFD